MGWPWQPLPKRWSRMQHRNVHSIFCIVARASFVIFHWNDDGIMQWGWVPGHFREAEYTLDNPHIRVQRRLRLPLNIAPASCCGAAIGFFLYLCQSVSRKAWDNYVQCIVLSFKKAVGKLGCIFNGVLWYMSTHTQLILYMYIYITIFTHQRVGTKVILLRDNWGMDGWFMTGGMDNLTRFDRFSPPKVWGRLFLDVLWMRYSYQQPKVE